MQILTQQNQSPSVGLKVYSDLKFDWAATLLSLWLVGGIHLDAWAHHKFPIETFFTPWHGVLYSGFLCLAMLLFGSVFYRHQIGESFRKAIPTGYELSLSGVSIFLLGGLLDMLWHILFGIENNIEALISPSHLLLALGGGLMIAGPLRSAWRKTDTEPGLTLFPAIISASLLLSIFTFFTAYANPLSEAVLARGTRPPLADQANISQALGMAGILLQSGLMMGIILWLVRRWRVPFGSMTLLLSISVFLGVAVHEDYALLPFAIFSGLIFDMLIWLLNPTSQQHGSFRLFAFLAPVLFYTFYFATLSIVDGLWWSVHMWSGAIVLAGFVGWLLSYTFAPICPIE